LVKNILLKSTATVFLSDHHARIMLHAVDDAWLKDLETTLHSEIPLTRSMGLQVIECNGHGLLIRAPLAPNINHAATAFGGSLAAATTLVSWGMLWLVLKHLQQPAQIVIQESNISYLRPVTQDFIARCQYPSEAQVSRLLSTYERYGKGRIELQSEIYENNKPCVGFRGRFVILPD
jgi:thioesterase domain-containing protein